MSFIIMNKIGSEGMIMAFCESCGKPLATGAAFCTSCGAPIKAAPRPTYAQTPLPPPQPPVYDAPNGFDGDACPPRGARHAVISSWGYVGTLLLLCLPVVGFILTIVWACGGAHNLNRVHLARAILLMELVCVIAAIVCYVLYGTQITEWVSVCIV